MTEPVSVIILNWNGEEYIEDCLLSVFAQDYAPLEVIVVDNASSDGSADMVERRFPRAILVRNETNLGFGAGNNRGIRKASGKCIVVLNNDAQMERECVTELKKALDKDEQYGAAAAKILLKHERGLIDAAGIVVCPDGLSIGRGRLEQEGLFDKEEEVFFASGCCAMFRKEMLEDIAVDGEYYDEDFFAYADDTDLGWRARIRGWRCIYAPLARAYHLHSASAGTYSPLKAFLVERNRLWLQVKSFPLPLILCGQAYTLARYAYQAYGALRGRGAAGGFTAAHSRMALVRVLTRVYVSAFKGLPRMLRKRGLIRRKGCLGTVELFRMIKRYGISTRKIALTG
jgi:GT2 family glycosyltransferase